ncbi:hypothetical protein BTZ20_5859 [Rhodococcus sp. MTM3W5.2]|nr:hypothetical protein BTZ20_5859 [Rhodococcus sp. MTM3W5.2]
MPSRILRTDLRPMPLHPATGLPRGVVGGDLEVRYLLGGETGGVGNAVAWAPRRPRDLARANDSAAIGRVTDAKLVTSLTIR